LHASLQCNCGAKIKDIVIPPVCSPMTGFCANRRTLLVEVYKRRG
jgi:hypothetical protein